MCRQWLRLALVGGALLGLAAAIVHPDIRWLAFLQTRMLARLPVAGDTPALYGVIEGEHACQQRLTEVAAKHPDDYEIQAGACLLSRTSFFALVQLFRSNPAVYAHVIADEYKTRTDSPLISDYLLWSSLAHENRALVVAGILGIAPPILPLIHYGGSGMGGPVVARRPFITSLSYGAPVTSFFLPQPLLPPLESIWQDILRLSTQGELLAPANAFFAFFRFLSLAEMGRDEEAKHALMTAAEKTTWDDYEPVVRRGVRRVLQQGWGKPPAFALYFARDWVEENTIAYYSIFARAGARALRLVRQCETSGRIAESLDLRLAMARCGSIVMRNARSESTQDAGAFLVWQSAAELSLPAALLQKRMDELLPMHLERLRQLGREKEAEWWQPAFRAAAYSLSTSPHVSADPEERIRYQLFQLSRLWRRNLAILLVLALLLPTWVACSLLAYTRYRKEPVALVLLLPLVILLTIVLSYSEAAQTLWALPSWEEYWWYTPDSAQSSPSGSYISALLQWLRSLFPQLSAGDTSEYRPFAMAFVLAGVLLVFVFAGALWAFIQGYIAAESFVQGVRYAGLPIIAVLILLYAFGAWQTARLEAKTCPPLEDSLRGDSWMRQNALRSDRIKDSSPPSLFSPYVAEEY